MNHRIILLIFILINTFTLIAETSQTIEVENQFGGKTIEITYEPSENRFESVSSSRLYYDKNNVLIKSIYRLSPKKVEETGYIFQEQEYKENKIVAYKMYLAESEKQKRGYDFLVDFVNKDDVVTSCIYGFGETIVREKAEGFAFEYPFYKLSYLFSKIYEIYEPNPNGDKIDLSAKYYQGRSLIKFVSDLIPMDEKDKRIAGYYFGHFNLTKYLELYNNKINIEEDGTIYTMYVQDQLIDFCNREKKALITFVVLGYNHKLYPLVVSLIDVE